jgi:hypothetical protein
MDKPCKICSEIVTERSHFWKIHRIKEKDYYEKYYPKQDLLTGEKIEFRNPEQHSLADFKDKRNLKTYLEKISKEEGVRYLTSWLCKRQFEKKTSIAPSQFEIKSLHFPSIKYIEKSYGTGSYKEICNLANDLLCRYDYSKDVLEQENKNLEFIIDTREQSIIDLPNFQVKKLEYGDYSIINNTFRVFIERKSLVDFIGTLSKGYERFQKELYRCHDDIGYMVILIEEKYSNLLSFNYLPHCKKIEATPDFIMHRARELLRIFPYIQMLAVDGRKEASRVIPKIFKLKGDSIRTTDLQFYYDKGLL